ncbi:hypothetical protein LJR030_003362 [Rhizobium sp. LjRoot30]|uniref:hypothetical protein n=1 Tax=Rhizobium sp. LjRoot30 TaxID=3342320 RepID=UPI003ECECDA2
MTMIRVGMYFAMLTLAATAAGANESSYTDMNTDKCKTLSRNEEESGSVSLKCRGLDGYPVYFKEGDARQSVFFGPVSQSYIDGAFESFGMFNYVGKKVEWRVDDSGTPVAAILRYFISNLDPETGMPTKELEGQVLVISRVAQSDDESGCVAAYVDALANGDANGLARQVADDMAANFTCGQDEPSFHGERGERASEPSRYLPE